MSLLESTLEDLEFNKKTLVDDLDDRIAMVMSVVAELESSIEQSDLRDRFQSLRSTHVDHSDLQINTSIALVYLACKWSCGQQWEIFGEKFVWDMLPRPVQLKAGILLCDEIGENRFVLVHTGEGKTLINLFPIAYHSLFGNVHVMSSNNYLAQRDQMWIGPALGKLGIISAYLPHSDEIKRSAYKARVLFGSDKEFAFDFLRDSVRGLDDDKLCTARDYIVVDEADHVMLDELETPVILSSPLRAEDHDVEIAGTMVADLIHLQENYVEDLKKKLTQGIYRYNDKRDYLKMAVQVKYSGIDREWLTSLFGQDPKLKKQAERFERTYASAKGFQKHVEEELYFVVDTDRTWCSLTEKGMTELENSYPGMDELFLVPDYDRIERSIKESGLNRYRKKYNLKKNRDRKQGQMNLLSAIRSALMAQTMLRRDIDYIVTDDNRIELITQSTGRSDPQKKYQRGLSQAVECKENVSLTEPDIVVTSSTLPAFLAQYSRICAVSGTLSPDQAELKRIYSMESFAVPRFKEPRVKHLSSELFATKSEKRKALMKDVLFNHSLGRPVLIGSCSVKDSEEIHELLSKTKIPGDPLNGMVCRSLNARNEHEEAEIISQAGQLHAVTISTNMAGRGVDIKVAEDNNRYITKKFCAHLKNLLDNNHIVIVTAYSDLECDLLLQGLKETGLERFIKRSRKRIIKKEFIVELDPLKGYQKENHETIRSKTVDNGKIKSETIIRLSFHTGLYVIGDELNRSNRINDQLRGRTGRQGNTGSTKFYASAEDDQLKNSEFAELFLNVASFTNHKRTRDSNNWVSGSRNFIKSFIDKVITTIAQEAGESRARSMREESLFFGSTLEAQRKCVAEFRETVLDGSIDTERFVNEVIRSVIDTFVKELLKEKMLTGSEYERIKYTVESVFNTNLDYLDNRIKEYSMDLNHKNKLYRQITDHIFEHNRKRNQCFAANDRIEIVRNLIVHAIDSNWIVHLDNLDLVKESALLFSYSGSGIREQYVKRAFKSFQEFSFQFQLSFMRDYFHTPLPKEIISESDKVFVSDEVQELI